MGIVILKSVIEMMNFFNRGSSEQLTVGAQVFKSRSIDIVERFLLSIRLENREKLAKVGQDI